VRLQGFMLAKAAVVTGDDLTIVGAWVTRIDAEAFPWRAAQLSVVISLALDDDDFEQEGPVAVEVSVALRGEEPMGAAQWFSDRAGMREYFAEKNAVDEPRILNCVGSLSDALWQSPGTYDLSLTVDGVPFADMPLIVVPSDSPARFRREGDRVEVEGTVLNRGPLAYAEESDKVIVFTLPEGHRPASELSFEVASQTGVTEVVVRPTGELLADPTAGWIRLNGVTFEIP
jgi:hypothetical protein